MRRSTSLDGSFEPYVRRAEDRGQRRTVGHGLLPAIRRRDYDLGRRGCRTPAPLVGYTLNQVDPGHRRDESCRGGAQHLAHSPDLGDPTAFEHHEPRRERRSIHRVMRDDNRGCVGRGQLVVEHRAHICRGLGVERRQRLVEQQDLRRGRQGAGDRDPLLLPTRQLPGTTVPHSRQTDAPQPVVRIAEGDLAVDAARAGAEGDVLSGREVWKKPRVLTEQHRAALRRGDVPTRPIGGRDIPIPDPDASARHPGEARDRREQGRLSCPARAHHRDDLARLADELRFDPEALTCHNHLGGERCSGHPTTPAFPRLLVADAGRQARTSSSTRMAVTSSSSESATAVPCPTPDPLNAV